jgi:hypothetical protein
VSGEPQGRRFDPRHDAIYQRGYQPGDEPRTDAAASVAHAATDSAAQPAAQPSRQGAPQPSPRDDAPAAVAAAPLGEGHGPVITEHPRNPFIRALWIVGIAMIVASLFLQWQANSRSGFNYSTEGGMPIEMLVQQMVWSVASPILLVGIMTIVALLFWHGFHWRARDAGPSKPAPSRDDAP